MESFGSSRRKFFQSAARTAAAAGVASRLTAQPPTTAAPAADRVRRLAQFRAARAAKAAFHAAWWQKWMVHRRARPEVFAGRIHYHFSNRALYPIHEDALNSPVLDLIQRRHGSWFLPQAYSEGSPVHSSYPSGHATVAGACVTMLKAFFRESYVLPEPVVASPDGRELLAWKGADLTAGNELDKLAFNIGMARNFAGIHWRTDAWEGMKLGEQVAIYILRDMAASYAEDFGGFHLTRFDGSKITITADGSPPGVQ
jgi:hypothetical protein